MIQLSEQYLSSSEAAHYLGIHPFAIHKLIGSGKISAEKVANRWLIRREQLEEFAESYVPMRGRPRLKRKYTKRSPRWQSK